MLPLNSLEDMSSSDMESRAILVPVEETAGIGGSECKELDQDTTTSARDRLESE